MSKVYKNLLKNNIMFLKSFIEIMDYEPVYKRISKYNMLDIYWELAYNRQILDLINQLPEEMNIFEIRKKRIRDIYGTNLKILEIGAGSIPSLALKLIREGIAKYCTVYDPRLLSEFLVMWKEELDLHKSKFNSNFDITNYDLVIINCNYEGAKDAIELCNLYGIDFYLIISLELKDSDIYKIINQTCPADKLRLFFNGNPDIVGDDPVIYTINRLVNEESFKKYDYSLKYKSQVI